MGVIYTKTDQGSSISSGTGIPTHSAVAGDYYTDTTTGFNYTYTTSWQKILSGAALTYFTEAQATTGVNATVYVDSLTAVASTTDADFVIRPKGTGAILGRIPDGTITGGNKRGTNAVDLQTFISNAAIHVASGINSVVVGGSYNKATGLSSSVLGGSGNTAASHGDSVLGGDGNQAIGGFSIAGGRYSQANATTSVAFGYQCIVNGLDASVAMGYANTITGGYHTTVFGGYNTTSGYLHFVGGRSNTIVSGTASVLLGQTNRATGNYHFLAGYNHVATAPSSSTLLGVSTIDGGYSRMVYGTTGYVRGDSQASKVLLNGRTTTATPKILSTNILAVDATSQLTLQNYNSIRFKGSIIGRNRDSNDTSAWDIDGIIQRGFGVGTTTLLIGNVNVVQNTPAWGTPTLAANTTLGCLTVTVIGAAANIQWTCSIDTTEVIYAALP
jgi:hypothetical protein